VEDDMPVAIPVVPGRLRAAAEQIERITGLQVQIIGGVLMMSPTPRGQHAGVIRRLRNQLEARLPADLGAFEVSSILMPDGSEDYVTPDLTVLPAAWENDDEWLADPADVTLAIEVISGSERARSIAHKTRWYATAGVSALLAIDPRDGTWALYDHPRDSAYQGLLHGKYGDPIPLPAPLSGELTTDQLPLYS
jgi:Uma2 family endonuclease